MLTALALPLLCSHAPTTQLQLDIQDHHYPTAMPAEPAGAGLTVVSSFSC